MLHFRKECKDLAGFTGYEGYSIACFYSISEDRVGMCSIHEVTLFPGAVTNSRVLLSYLSLQNLTKLLRALLQSLYLSGFYCVATKVPIITRMAFNGYNTCFEFYLAFMQMKEKQRLNVIRILVKKTQLKSVTFHVVTLKLQ